MGLEHAWDRPQCRSGWRAAPESLVSPLRRAATWVSSAPLARCVSSLLCSWLPPPPGYEQGKCYVMPNSNVKGDDLDQIFNTTADACCDACDANPAW